MEDIEILDIEEITKANKKKSIKKGIKRTILGAVSLAFIFSLQPNIKYRIALHNAKQNKKIESILESDNISRTEQIKQIFEYAIMQNDNIDDNMKKKCIDAFSTEVIDNYGNYFTDNTIYNMYAVASTEKIKTVSSFAQKHGWWGGDYNSYFNVFTIECDDPTLIAHEQLHAILKTGLFGTGYTNGFKGYGINEGATSYMVANDSTYSWQKMNLDKIGLVIGYDKVLEHYVNSDLDGLIEEMCKYTTKENVNILISNLNDITFNDYYYLFLQKNDFESEYSEYEKYIIDRQKENDRIIEDIFTNKYGCSVDESNRGKLLKALNNGYNDDLDEDNFFFCNTFYNNDGTLSIYLHGANVKKNEYVLPCRLEDLPEDKESLANLVGIDEDYLRWGYSVSNNGKGRVTLHLGSACYKVNFEDIDSFDIDKCFKDKEQEQKGAAEDGTNNNHKTNNANYNYPRIEEDEEER